MVGFGTEQWDRLGQWSPLGFIVGGLGLLISFLLVGVRDILAVGVPELLISAFALPGMAILFLVALLGFYPYVADAAPRLALAGAVAALAGGATLLVTTLGAIGLQLTTETGFTQAEENPLLLALFFVMLLAFLLGFLLYGIASLWTDQPSRRIGALLVVAGVEPGSGLLFDVVGIDLGAYGPVITLGIAALAMVAVGYSLRAAPTGTTSAEAVSA